MVKRIALAAILLALLAARCGGTLGPVWARAIEGRVVDARTGEPVPGAIVEAFHPVYTLGFRAPGRIGETWTTTDAAGRFLVPGRLALTWLPASRTDPLPELVVFHPEFGWTTQLFRRNGRSEFPGWDRIEVQLAVEPRMREHMRTVRGASRVCGTLGPDACREACRMIYGEAARCEGRRKAPRPTQQR